jgi:uncharacterized protein (DUF433 family)
MSRVVSRRLRDDQIERLQRAAARLGRTPSQAAALLLEESLRQHDYPFIEFRDSRAGRQAYLQNSRIAVWHVASVAREFDGDASKVAVHLEISEARVKAALAYASAFPDEIDAAIADNAWVKDHELPLTPGYAAFDAFAG